MKPTLILSTILCLLTSVAMAQSSLTPEERAQMQTEWMKVNLKLNNSQLVRIDAINIEYAQKMEKVKDIDGKSNKLKAAKKISEEKDEKLKQLLNEEQFQLYLDHKKELRKNAKNMYKERNRQRE